MYHAVMHGLRSFLLLKAFVVQFLRIQMHNREFIPGIFVHYAVDPYDIADRHFAAVPIAMARVFWSSLVLQLPPPRREQHQTQELGPIPQSPHVQSLPIRVRTSPPRQPVYWLALRRICWMTCM